MNHMRPGPHSLNAARDAGAAQGYEAMYPQNIANAYDNGMRSKVAMEHQPEIQMTYQGQKAQADRRSSIPYEQVQAKSAMDNASREQSQKDAKVQAGLNEMLSQVIDKQVATGGQHLDTLARVRGANPGKFDELIERGKIS